MRQLGIYLLTGLLLPSAALASDEVRKERIQFDKGKTGTTLEGQIQGHETVHYLLGAGAKQTMTVDLETEHGATYFNVFAPGSKPGRDRALFVGDTGGKRFEGVLTDPGDYLIQVYMMRSAARRDETAKYTLDVSITGKVDPTVKAPDPGPWPADTDASGFLPCSKGGEELDLQCPFRVKRNTYGATLWVIRPGDDRDPKEIAFAELRTLYFEQMNDNSTWSALDAGHVSADRDGDSWIVKVGNIERYWIPDAAIWGG